MVEIGAFYYPWYDKDRHWSEGSLQKPILGQYCSSDVEVIAQHIAWAKSANLNFFLVSWWGKNSFEDKVIKENLSFKCNEDSFQYCLVYESSGQLSSRNGRIQIDLQENIDQVLEDFRYLSEEIFSSATYYRIDGRPVVFMYLSRTFEGDVQGLLNSIRSVCKLYGHNPYLIGDEVYWLNPFNVFEAKYKAYDAISLYNPHISIPKIISNYWDQLPKLYTLWESYCEEQGLKFIPTIIPGFNDTPVRPEARHSTIPRDKDRFIQMLNSYIKQNKLSHLFICSWNEWHENTQIEPSSEENILDL